MDEEHAELARRALRRARGQLRVAASELAAAAEDRAAAAEVARKTIRDPGDLEEAVRLLREAAARSPHPIQMRIAATHTPQPARAKEPHQ